MPALPSVRGTSRQALYPFTRRVTFVTEVQTSANGSEQRCATRAPLFEMDLTYNGITRTDRDALVAMLATEHGSFGQDLSLTVGGSTWNNLKLTDDSITFNESTPNLYTTTLHLRQVSNRAYSLPAVALAWPTFTSGARVQLPYGQQWRQLSTVNDQPSGYAYPWKWYGASLTGFPTGSLLRWPLSLMLTDADVPTLENLFLAAQGRCNTISFTDPETATVYANCRFDQDVLELRYLGVNQTAVQVTVVQTQ